MTQPELRELAVAAVADFMDWLRHGNSTGDLSEHAQAGLVESIVHTLSPAAAETASLREERDRLRARMDRIALDVNHALMVLPVPTDGQGKRAWASLLDAKTIAEQKP